jgi:hypothetical protein
MSFTNYELEQLESLLSMENSASQLLVEFRSRFPGRSLTHCAASDVDVQEPFRKFPTTDLYLVDGRNHCWEITRDPSLATGVLLAAHADRV